MIFSTSMIETGLSQVFGSRLGGVGEFSPNPPYACQILGTHPIETLYKVYAFFRRQKSDVPPQSDMTDITERVLRAA